jgi:hypothetical protein
MSATPQVRMDKSRTFATVHGDRLAGDTHQNVHFYQDGLPFDAKGMLVADHPEVVSNDKLMALVERKMKKAQKAAPVENLTAPAGDGDDDEVDGDSDDGDKAGADEPINLSSWARGEQKLEWQLVTNAIGQRFSVRVGSKLHAIELLLKEGIVTKGDLSREHQKLVAHLD